MHKNKMPPTSSFVESKLLNLSRWAIRGVQLIGYFPLIIRKISIKNHPSTICDRDFIILDFCLPSGSVMLSIVLVILMGLWDFQFFSNASYYQRYLPLFGPTEKIAHLYYGAMLSLIGLYFRLRGLLQGKATLAFWKESCSTVDMVQSALGFIKGDMLDKQCFIKIKSSSRNYVLLNATCILIYTIQVYGSRLYRSLTDETTYWSSDSTFHIGSAFWNCMTMLHVLHTSWTCFFLQLYKGCFTCVRERIVKLPELHLANYNGGMIYMNEFFTIKRKPHQNVNEELSNHNISELDNQLEKSIDAYILLEKQVSRFNNFFGDKLIAELVICITFLVVNSFFLTLWIGRGFWRQVVVTMVPVLIFSHNLYRLASDGGALTIEAESLANILFQRLPMQALSSNIQFKVQLLLTRMGSHPPVVSAWHFFVVNRSLVTSVLGAMTTFLVVLVQFRDADNTGLIPPAPRQPRPGPTL